MPSVLVTGAGRGLGLEFARQYAADGWKVIATVRDAGSAQELGGLAGDIRIETLDVSHFPAIAPFAARLGDVRIDHLICNAGIMGPTREPDPAEWLKTLAVNAIAPTLLARALVDRMAPGGKLVAITSQMGSIEDNSSGGYIAYRSSKAALNAAWRSLAIDWRDRDLAIALLHPGWVQTDMGGADATTTPRDSVAGMRRVVDGLERARSGSFLDFRGQPIPW